MSPAEPHLPADAPAAAHLPAAVLRQYAAGTLTAAERRRVELHTLDCPLCADALDGYLLAPPAAIAPPAMAELQRRLHARVAEAPAQTRPAVWWMAAAAAVAVLLVALGVWWPAGRQELASRKAVEQQAEAPAPVASAPQPRAAPAPASPAAPAADAAEAASPSVAMAPTAPPAAQTRPQIRQQPAYAAAPKSGQTRARASARRPAPASVKSEPLDITGLGDAASGAAASDMAAEVAADSVQTKASPTIAAAPARAKMALREAAVESEQGNARMAVAPAAPAAAPSTAFEGVAKRKAAMPPAPDIAPMPAGGYRALSTYLLRERRPPNDAQAPGVSGVVKLKFTVEADGSVENIQVVKSLHPDYDEEAIRLVCEGPAWRPGIQNGRRASMPVFLDVPFR